MKKNLLITFYLLLFLTSQASMATPFTVNNLLSLKPHYALVKNGRIKYYQFGHGNPTLILISGYGANMSYWNRYFLVTLAKQHQVIVFDNRNVGGTQISSSSYTSKDLANDTYNLINALHVQQPVVIGMSMGGMIAQAFAVAHPDRLRGLILINTAIAGSQSVKPNLAVQDIIEHVPKGKVRRYLTMIRLMAPPIWWGKIVLSLATERFDPIGQKESTITRKVLDQQQQLVTQWITDNTTAKKIAALNIPVLILNGGKDGLIPPANSTILARVITHSRLVRWPQGGHIMTYQFPNSIAAVINHFIADHLPIQNPPSTHS